MTGRNGMKLPGYIDSILSKFALLSIRAYQKTLSPDVGLLKYWLAGTVCRHEPHCSEYCKECFEKYGFIDGLYYSMERIIGCVPGIGKKYDPSSYRVVFFSSAQIGIPFLNELMDDFRFDVITAVTQPPAASGRGMKLRKNCIELAAKDHGVPVLTPRSLRLNSKKRSDDAKEFEKTLISLNPDLLVVIAYGNILPQSVLDLPQFGAINVHGSILPEYRGASPLQAVFLDERIFSGVTIMKMNAGLDEGPILTTHTIPLGLNDDVKYLIGTIEKKAPKRLTNTTWKYLKEEIDPIEQDSSLASHCGKIVKEDGEISFNDSLRSVFSKYKGYALWPKTYFYHDGKRVIIEELNIQEDLYEGEKDSGFIVKSGDVWTHNKAINVLKVKPEGSKSMLRDDFLRGYA